MNGAWNEKAMGSSALTLRRIVVMAALLGATIAWNGVFAVRPAPVTDLETAGGTMTWALNIDAMAPLGIALDTAGLPGEVYSPAAGGHYATLVTHAAETSGLVVMLEGEHLRGLSGGHVELHDGPRLILPRQTLNLRHARIRPSAPPSFALAITDGSTNKIWATLDHPHYGRGDDHHALWIDDADLHVGPALAEALGHPEWTGIVLGRAGFDLPIVRQRAHISASSMRSVCLLAWPSATAKVDLALIDLNNDPELGGLPDTIAYMRCGVPQANDTYSTCTPTSIEGLVVFAPDAAVKNVGTAAIAWHPMFTGYQAPYGNDQHPYLIWNLYRIDSDGRIRQIGQSGAKHAYYADNFHCTCPQGLASYPGCEETYAAGTNDMLAFLGPRSEIIPATGQWGRCGSVFDPKCLGQVNSGVPRVDDGYKRRLAIREAELLPALHPGARYIFEYGYIVRDDSDPEHAFAHRLATPAKTVAPNGAIHWGLTASSFDNGPAINAWVDPQHPTVGTMNQRITTAEGHFRVAVRTAALGQGRYRYDYAILNEDFARAVTEGAEPNLHVRSANGFNKFTVPLPQGAHISSVMFADADENPGNDWAPMQASLAIAWTAPGDNPLNWGTLYSFSFTATASPIVGKVRLQVAQPGVKDIYIAPTLVPGH